MRLMLTPHLLAQLLEPLTVEETDQCWEYARACGWDEFNFRATEWLMRHFNLSPGPVPEGTPEDAVVMVKRVLPREHE